jgi:uncharacterized protein YidB (DUF937 family)
MTELGSVKRSIVAPEELESGIEERAIAEVARKTGLDLSEGDCRQLALVVRRLAEQVRAGDAEFEHDDPFPAYLT